jgi:hypothetical protein
VARPRDFNEVEIKNFKGLDFRGPAELTPQDTFQTLINFEIGLAGELKKRPGFVRQHNGATLGANPVRILGEYSSTSNNLHQIIAQTEVSAGAGKVYASVDSGVTWTQISTPAGTNYVCGKGVQYNQTFYIPTSVAGNLFGWNSGGWQNAGTASAPASVNRGVILQDRLFLLESPTLNIKFSDPGAFNSWPAANSIGYKTEDRDQPVGIIAYRDRLIILRQNSIQVLYLNGPPSSWVLKSLPYNIGVINENCAFVYNDLLYLLCLDGIYRTDLTSLDEISKPLFPSFYQRRKLAFNSPSVYQDCMGYWNGRIICSARTGTFEARLFVYNIDNQTWSEWLPSIPLLLGTNFPYAPFREFLTVSIGRRAASSTYTKEGMYGCYADNGGKIMLFDDQNPIYTDEVSSTYNAIAKSRNFNADLSSDLKRSYDMSIRGHKNVGADVQGMYNVNGIDGTPFTIPIDTVPKQVKFKGPGWFREASIQLSDNTSSYLEIEALTLSLKRKSQMSEAKM